MKLPILKYKISPETINVSLERVSIYPYIIAGVFTLKPDSLIPVKPIFAIAHDKLIEHGEVEKLTPGPHTCNKYFTFAANTYYYEYAKDNVQNLYVSFTISDWYYQRAKKHKTIIVRLFDTCGEEIFSFFMTELKFRMVLSNTKPNTYNWIVMATEKFKNYKTTVDNLILLLTECAENVNEMELNIEFY